MLASVCAAAVSGCSAGVESLSSAPAASESGSFPVCAEEGHAEDRVEYRSVGQLADSAASAVEATVTSKGAGAQSGEDTFMEYTMRTEQILAGNDMPSAWQLRTGYLHPSGCEVAFNGLGTLEVGDRAVLFVLPAGGAGPDTVWSSAGTQGRFEIDGEDIADTRRRDALTKAVEQGSAAQLRADARNSSRGRK